MELIVPETRHLRTVNKYFKTWLNCPLKTFTSLGFKFNDDLQKPSHELKYFTKSLKKFVETIPLYFTHLQATNIEQKLVQKVKHKLWKNMQTFWTLSTKNELNVWSLKLQWIFSTFHKVFCQKNIKNWLTTTTWLKKALTALKFK